MQHKRHSLLQRCTHALRRIFGTVCPSAHPGGASLQDKRAFLFFQGNVPVCCLAFGTLFVLALPGRPVDSLHIERMQGAGLERILPLGHSFATRYIHSVERTPVEDIYYGMDGRIHQWRTRTRSHNAGLPAVAPVPGRFVSDGSWLVLEGGRLSWDEFYLRSGTAQFGQNELLLQTCPPLLLYELFPGERLRFSVKRLPLHTFFPIREPS